MSRTSITFIGICDTPRLDSLFMLQSLRVCFNYTFHASSSVNVSISQRNWKYSIKTKATPTTRSKSMFLYFSFHLLLLRSAPEGEPITMYGNTRWSCGWVPCTILERNFNYRCSRKDRGQSPILHSFLIGLKLKKLKKMQQLYQTRPKFDVFRTF